MALTRILFSCLIFLAVFSGCSKPKNIGEKESNFKLYIVVDAETGCQYLITGFNSPLSEHDEAQKWGLTPRLGTNGKIICTKVVK